MTNREKQPAEVRTIYTGRPKWTGNADASEPMAQEWYTSIFKEPSEGPLYLGEINLEGDEQADLRHHGGPDKAVFVYPSEHYSYWQDKLSCEDISAGGMGENFSTFGICEEDTAIGDIFQIGGAIVQVSQPRQPCWKPARRFGVKELAVLQQNAGRTGWYFRVLQEGIVEAGMSLQLVERKAPEWTIAKCNEVMHMQRGRFELAAKLAAVEELADSWKKTLHTRAELRQAEDIERRVYGPNAGS